MARPSYTEWKTLGSSTDSLVPQTLWLRILAALGSYTIRTAPDGTTF